MHLNVGKRYDEKYTLKNLTQKKMDAETELHHREIQQIYICIHKNIVREERGHRTGLRRREGTGQGCMKVLVHSTQGVRPGGVGAVQHLALF